MKVFKGFILGMVVTLLVTLTVPVLANGVWKSIDVAMNSVNVEVNGKKVDSDNFILEGTTYIPLRSVGELLNKNIIWNETTRTVSINDKVGGADVLPTKDIEASVKPVVKEEVKEVAKVEPVVEEVKVENTNTPVKISIQKFMPLGNITYNTCVFEDGFVVAVNIAKHDYNNKEGIFLHVWNKEKTELENKKINIVGFSDYIGEKYYPLTITNYSENISSKEELREVDFFESLKNSKSTVGGYIFYDSFVNLEGIVYDDGVHSCKLYLEDKE